MENHYDLDLEGAYGAPSAAEYYGLDFDKIYAASKVRNNTAKVKRVLKRVPNADFNDVDKLVELLKADRSGKPVVDTTIAKDIKTLATFINLLEEPDLAKMGITNKQFLVKGGKGSDRGTYHKKKDILENVYHANRESGELTPAQQERMCTIEQYDQHYEKCWETVEPLLSKVTLDEKEANVLVKNGLVIIKHDMPDMRGGSTYAEMLVDHQSKHCNYTIYSPAMEQIIFIYNRYKTSDKFGVIPEIISKGQRVYSVVEKMILVSQQHNIAYLFFDYEKKMSYTPQGFNKLIASAHEAIGITQADIRIIDESIDLDKVNPVDLHEVSQGRKRRGHNMLQGYLYAKHLKEY